MARATKARATVSLSWARANALAEASNLTPAQARNFVSSYKGTDEAQQLYDYLDSDPSWRDNYGKNILSAANSHRASRARHGSGSRNSGSKTRAVAKRQHTRRASIGDPTREPRAGAPNPMVEEHTFPVRLLQELRDLQRTYGDTEVRTALSALELILQ